MAAPLVDHVTGDVIAASHLNDVKLYIEDGTYRTNTLSLNIGGTEVISSSRNVKPVKIISPDSGGILFYASDGVTLIARLDNNGNMALLGHSYNL